MYITGGFCLDFCLSPLTDSQPLVMSAFGTVLIPPYYAHPFFICLDYLD